MFDPKDFQFDAEKIADFFRNNDFTSHLNGKMASADDVIESQKKNMEALVEANKAAASSYQDIFTKQVEVFEKTMEQAKANMGDVGKISPDAAKTVLETALKNMSDLATSAQKANAEAMEIVGKRVQESINEMQDTSNKPAK